MTPSGGGQGWDADHLKRQLQAMDDFDFEHLIADLWERQGWETEVEQQSGDAGVDVRATKQTPYSQKALLQAKRYSSDNPLGGPDVQQYAALKHQEANVDKAVVVTTGRFTGSAEDRADDLNVKLIDGDGLVQIIDQFDAYDIVEDYLGATAPQESHGTASSDTSTDEGFYLPPKEREELSQKIDGDVDEYLKNKKYRGARALEQARAKVKINPTEAAQLGAFDDVNDIDPKREFEQHKAEIALLSDHVHMDNEETAFIGDLTEFVSASAIDADANQNVVAIVERGTLDEEWAADGFLAKILIKLAKRSEPSSLDETSSAAETSQPTSAEPVSEDGADATVGQPEGDQIQATPVDGFRRWHWVAAATTVLTYATVNVSEILFVLPFLATFVALYLDIRHIQPRTEWSPRKWFYFGVGFIAALLTVPIYLINRYRFVSTSS